MTSKPFDRNEHIYKSDAFAELVKDVVQFFNGTPVHELPPPVRFTGSGVYALYYTGKNPLYAPLAAANRLSYDLPIYVGKAVPRGWRQGRVSDNALAQSNELHSRINEHTRNIRIGGGLDAESFACRFVIFEETGSDMISTIEAALIKIFRPLWNTAVDGFGNHTPGAGRFEQARSDWDVIHPGRTWADMCKGIPKTEDLIHNNISAYYNWLAQRK